MAPQLTVLVAEPGFLVRSALSSVIEKMQSVSVTTVCEEGDLIVSAALDCHADVVVTSLGTAAEGLRAASRLASLAPEIGVVLLGDENSDQDSLAILHNARGRAFLLKDRLSDAGELEAAIRAVSYGDSLLQHAIAREVVARRNGIAHSPLAVLTSREQEVLSWMAAGLSNTSIAQELVLSRRAVEKHIRSIFNKLEIPDQGAVSRRVAAVLIYLRHTGQ